MCYSFLDFFPAINSKLLSITIWSSGMSIFFSYVEGYEVDYAYQWLNFQPHILSFQIQANSINSFENSHYLIML